MDDGINPEVVILKQEPGMREPPALIDVSKPVLVKSNLPPPLVPVQSRIRARQAGGPPRLVPTPLRRLGRGNPKLKTTPASNVPAPTANQSVQSQSSASNTNPCLIGQIYNVSCHRKYLGAAHVLLEWSDLEPATQETILSKIRNQAKPEVNDFICHHHLKELSYVEEPDPRSPDQDKGFCAGHGIVHKAPALTTRLGVLTYYCNNLAGKHRDVIPGKFVCSTCIRILRGAPGSVTTADSTPAEVGFVKRNARFRTPTSARRVNPYHIRFNERDPGSELERVEHGDEEMEVPLHPSDITISGSYLGRNQIDFERDLKTEFENTDMQLQDCEDGDGEDAPQFDRLNAILAAAGISPFLVNSDSEALKSQARAKLRELVQNCVNILQEGGLELDVQSVFDS